MKKGRWSDEDRALLRRLYLDQVDVAEIAERLGCSVDRVRDQARRLGLHRKAKAEWTEDEIATLNAEYATCGHPRELAEKLGRPIAGVFDKAYKLGLKRPGREPWTPEEDEIIRRGHAAGKSLIEIAEEVGRKYTTVAKRASKALGLAFNMGPRKKQSKPTTPARASTKDVAGDTPVCCEPQTKPSGGAAARRMECLRIAAKFRDKKSLGLLNLAEKIDAWAGRKDRALRLQALEIAASRAHNTAAVWREAARYLEWAGAADGLENGYAITGARAREGIPSALDRLEALAAGHTGVSVQIMRGDSRVARFVRARHLLCYLAHHLAGAGFAEIGRRLGGREHSSISYAIRLVEAARPEPEIENQLAAIAAQFGADLPPPLSSGAGQESAAKAAKTEPAPRSEPIQAPAPERKPEPRPAATAKPESNPAAKPEPAATPKPKPAARPPARQRPARPRAEDRPLSEAEEKVLRAIIRKGITRTGALEPVVGLPLGPLTKVLQGLGRKSYVEIHDGAIRVKRLPSGEPMPGLRQADATVRVVKPAPPPARPASRQARRPAARPAPSIPAPRPNESRCSEDEPAMRRCLGCDEMFPSDGFGNRMCTSCKSRKVQDESWMGGSF